MRIKMGLPATLHAATPGKRYSSVAAVARSGTRSITTKPMMNSTTMESTPSELLPVAAVMVPTMKVPRMAAYLPKMSKNPKYSLAWSLGQSLPNSDLESACRPPWKRRWAS